MKALKFYIILFLIGVLISCAKKKYPGSITENDSVYSFKASIDNQPVLIKAGIDDYYMYTSYKQDINDVYNLTGSLKQIDCADCRSNISIQINDTKVSPLNSGVQINLALAPGSYNFLKGTDYYEAQFQPVFNKQATSYLWDFGDGTTSTLANPRHGYIKPGQYKVNLNIKSSNGCESTIQNIEQVDIANGKLRAKISATAGGNNLMAFTQNVTGGKSPYRYLWSFGDGLTATNTNPSHTYVVRGAYPVFLKVTDANDEIVVVNYNAVTQNDPSSCAANYNIADITQQPNPLTYLGLSKIIISWTDADGIVYTSNSVFQPATSNFEMISVEDAGTNENKAAIKKLHIKFNCTVYNNTKSKLIENAEAIISVAYK